jgi:hypothetical protein
MNHIVYAIAVIRRDELLAHAAERRRAIPTAGSVDGVLSVGATRHGHRPRRLRGPRCLYR